MKVIKNKLLPFKGFNAINLFGLIFTRQQNLSAQTLRHEAIHTAQMRELAYIFFYVWYLIEYVIRLIRYRNSKEAYRNISFEREAYQYDKTDNYLSKRTWYSFLNYL